MENTQEKYHIGTFKDLTFRKKIDHILHYYKWYILGGAALLCLIVSLVSTIFQNQKESLISGIFVNTATSEEGYAHVQDEYWDYCGGDEDTKVDLVTYRALDFTEETLSESDAANFMVVSCMIAARTLDYIICDESSACYFYQQEVVLDLRELLSEETLGNLDILWQDGTPIAIRLAGSDFAEEYPLTAEDSCILFVGSTQNFDHDRQFLTYLLGE